MDALVQPSAITDLKYGEGLNRAVGKNSNIIAILSYSINLL
tara:strand:+ start:704 stop:826 length:123 start_codon:yes stop_codon:yes gene_type:complete